MKLKLDGLVAEHSIEHLRSQIGFSKFNEDIQREFPPARYSHPLPKGRSRIGTRSSADRSLPYARFRDCNHLCCEAQGAGAGFAPLGQGYAMTRQRRGGCRPSI